MQQRLEVSCAVGHIYIYIMSLGGKGLRKREGSSNCGVSTISRYVENMLWKRLMDMS
jgi:hypothetical protein